MLGKYGYQDLENAATAIENVTCVGVEASQPVENTTSYQSFHNLQPHFAQSERPCIRLGRWPRFLILKRILLILLMLGVYIIVPIIFLAVEPYKTYIGQISWFSVVVLAVMYMAMFTIALLLLAKVLLNLTRLCVWGAILSKAVVSICLYFFKAMSKYTCLSWCRCDFKSGLTLTEVVERYLEHPLLEKHQVRNEIVKNPFLSQILAGLNKQFAQFFFVVIPTGSLSEGLGKLLPHSSILKCDYDVLLTPSDSDVAVDDGPVTDRPTPFKAIQSTTPGYYWVQLKDERHKHFKPFCLKKYPSEHETQYFLSSEILNEKLLEHLLDLSLWMPADAGFPYKFQGKTIVPMSRYCNPKIAVKLDEPSISTSVKACIVNPVASLLSKCTKYAVNLSFSEIIFDADITFALPLSGWPDAAENWLTREHPWIDDAVFETVKSKGGYLVPKKRGTFLEEVISGAEYSARPVLEWSVTFAPCESVLIDHTPLKWKQVLIGLKAALMRRRNRGFLRTYHIKTVLLWALDSIHNPINYFDSTPLTDIFDNILSKLIGYLTSSHLPDYWLDDVNLLDECADCTTLEADLRFLNQLKADPVMILARNDLECQRCCQRRCCWPFRMNPPAGGGSGIVEEPCCYMSCAYNHKRRNMCACPFDSNFMDAY